MVGTNTWSDWSEYKFDLYDVAEMTVYGTLHLAEHAAVGSLMSH